MKNFIATSLLMITTAMTSSANAALILNLDNAVAGQSQDIYDIIGTKNGYHGATLSINDDELTELTFEFVGSEALWENKFIIRNFSNGEDESEYTIINHPDGETGVVKATDSTRQAITLQFIQSGLLDFFFTVNNLANGSGIDNSLNNADNKLPLSADPVNGNGLNYFIAFEYDENGGIESLLLGLDDGGRIDGTTDEDYNDLVIRITGDIQVDAPEVPAPASLPLFISALATGVVIAKRRNRLT